MTDLEDREPWQWRWIKAVKEAEKRRSLEPLKRVLLSDTPIEPWTRRLIAELHRRVPRKRGGQPKPIFKLTAEDEYAGAARVVRQLKKNKRVWAKWLKETEGAKIEVLVKSKGLKPGAAVWAKPGAAFIKRVRRYAEELQKISDPVAHVTEALGLDAQTLDNEVLGKTGWGRGRRRRKPKSKSEA